MKSCYCGQCGDCQIFKSKSGKLAWSDKFLAGQRTGQPKREKPDNFNRICAEFCVLVAILIGLMVLSGFKSWFMSGGY